MGRDCYILDDANNVIPVDIATWAKWFEKNAQGEKRHVGHDEFGDIRVSTVFIGLDHNFMPDGPPLIFETMVFRKGSGEEMERYSTWDEALAGHKRHVERVKFGNVWDSKLNG